MADSVLTASDRTEQIGIMLDALNKATEVFTSYVYEETTLQSILSDGLWPVANALNLDLISVFRVYVDNGRMYLGQVYRWMRSWGGTAPINSRLLMVPDNPVTMRWLDTLVSDKCVCLTISEMTEEELSFASVFGAKTMMLVPLIVRGDFWGCIAFDDFKLERHFSEAEVAFLRSAARLCASLIIRTEQTAIADKSFAAYRREAENSLSTLKNILNGLDLYVCVTEPETCKILFANDSIRKLFKIEGDGTGEYCYSLFQYGKTERCSYCPYYELKKNPNGVVRWQQKEEYVDMIHKKTALLIDWPGGKKAHLEYGVDVTESAKQQEMLENILDTMDSYIYVSDLETDEILFVNRAMKAAFKLSDDAHGDKCWKHVQLGQEKRCAWCNKPELLRNPEKPVLWEDDNPVTGTVLSIIDRVIEWPIGRKVHMHQGIDVTEIKRAQSALFNREEMLNTLNKAAIILLSGSGETFEDTMSEGIGIIAGMLKFDRMSVFRNSLEPDGMHASQVYRWSLSEGGTTKAIESLRDCLYSEVAPAWEAVLSAGNCINSPIRLLPENEGLKKYGCLTVFVTPIFMVDEFWGFVLFENLTKELAFSEYESDILRSAGHMAANAVIRNEEAAKIQAANNIAQLMTNKVETQNNLLYAVNRMSSILLKANADTFDRDLISSMGIVADAAEVDRMYIWKNSLKDGVLYTSQIYEWSEKVPPQQELLSKEAPFESIAPGWVEELEKGRCFNSIVRDLGSVQRSVLEPQGILSIMLVPIFVKGTFWGFLGFDDCHRERLFSDNKENILRSASELIAEAMIRNEMEENLRKATEKLRETLAAAQSANRAKSEFLSRMSHEMRTPMNAIIGMTAIGQGAEVIDRKNYALNKIDEASSHLLAIINDILDISKIEANKLELTNEAFSFNEMLRKAISFVQFRLEEKKQKFFAEIANNVPAYFRGDEQRLTQVIINLLTNAVKFTPELGEISIAASLLCEDSGLCELVFEITDNGIGIPPQQQERIFLAFEQAEGGISRKFGGSGLGLPISKSIIEKMGGCIKVESEENKGSKFIFTVKLEKSAPDALPKPKDEIPEDAANTNDEGRYAGKRILLAEDVEINREILLTLLDGTGIIIDEAENGREALDMIANSPNMYDLVLMDVQMPEMDGLEATRRIRSLLRDAEITGASQQTDAAGYGGSHGAAGYGGSHGAAGYGSSHGGVSAMGGIGAAGLTRKRLPIIAMTANVYQEDIDNCLEAGMDDHIGKPIDMNLVFEMFNKYLNPSAL
ncbi:MAG: response regulator [Clostridiales bacterium]|jgi:signal transduction histidine kinase/PAS domain-containing protein|nr:response regulator [Clostridiales bacterium]